jgi:hypothetical protein
MYYIFGENAMFIVPGSRKGMACLPAVSKKNPE